MSLSATVSERMLHEYWLPHFRDCVVEGHATSMMASYNAINGIPLAVNKLMLDDIPRGEWGFDGFIVCDLGGIGHLIDGHHLTEDKVVAVADALNAGCDYDDAEYRINIPKAVERKLVSEETVNRSLGRVLKVAFRLGVFDPPDRVRFSKIPESVIDSPAHRQLALKAAQESIVLLTNKDHFLPLDKAKLKSIAVIGRPAERPEYGNYYHYNNQQSRVDALEGLKNRLGGGVEIQSAMGCGILPEKTDEIAIEDAVKTAKSAEVAIVFAGTNLKVEAEDRDRKDLALPGAQERLIEAVYAANPRTVVVLMNAGPLSTKWARDHLPAMLEAWYGGEEAGNALADVLLGNVNPGARLPYTVYESADQVPPDSDYDITHGYTYMYFNGQPVFPFGHGLSYTSFDYGSLDVSNSKIEADGKLALSVEITNSGSLDGDEVVQFYGHQRVCSVKQPKMKLIAFQRIHLRAGEKRTVAVSVPADRMAIYDEKTHRFVVEPGMYDLLAGSSSGDIRARGAYEVVK